VTRRRRAHQGEGSPQTINRKLIGGLGVAALTTTALLTCAGSSLAESPDTLISRNGRIDIRRFGQSESTQTSTSQEE
jgi:hypothetical protein